MGADVALVGVALVRAAALNLSELQSTTRHRAPPGGGASLDSHRGVCQVQRRSYLCQGEVVTILG